MPVFEITAPDGKVYEVEGKSIEGAQNAFRQMMAQNKRADQIVQDFVNQDVKLNEQGLAEGFFTDPTKNFTLAPKSLHKSPNEVIPFFLCL